MMRNILVLFNTLALAFTLTINYLANALPIAGRTSEQVSNSFPTLFTPAGITFAIWGIIYLLLIGFVVYQWRYFSQSPPRWFSAIGWLFVASCLANGAWLPAFHHLYIGLSVLIMLALLGVLIMIYLRIHAQPAESAGERWLVRLPFSVYLGWISVATIANLSILLKDLGWHGEPLSEVFWTVVVLLAAIALALTALWQRRDIAYALVIIWALFGILSNRMGDITTDDGLVEMTALTGMGVIGVGVLWRLVRR